jgi:hypothetical protein
MAQTQETSKAEIIASWPELQWRHHGVGLLQAYMPERADIPHPRRVHLWHHSLVKPGIVDSGSKHNHRFELRSLVVNGLLLNTDLFPKDDKYGDHRIWRIAGASDRAKAVLQPMERVPIEEGIQCEFSEGTQYGLKKWKYHWARQPDDFDSITITLVDIIAKSKGWANLIAPFDKPPKHAFDEENAADPELMKFIVEQARGILNG